MKTTHFIRMIVIYELLGLGIAYAEGESWTVVASTGVADNEESRHYDVTSDRIGIRLNPQHPVACTHAYYNVTATPGLHGKPGARLTARFQSSPYGQIAILLQQTAFSTGQSSRIITLLSQDMRVHGEQVAVKETCSPGFSGFNFNDNAYHLIVQLCSKTIPKDNPIFKLAKIEGIDCRPK